MGTPITTATHIRRQAADGLIGYFGASGNYQASSCPAGSIWSTSGAYGLCCGAAGACQQVTACVGTTAIAYAGVTEQCPAVTPVCVADVILPSSGAANPVSWIGCDSAARAPITFYHNNPAAAAATTPATPTPVASTPAASTPAAGSTVQMGSLPATPGTGTSNTGGLSGSSVKTIAPASLTSVPVSTQTISGSLAVIYSVSTVPAVIQSASASTSGTSPSKASKVWIAGAVAGPIVFLLIVAGLLFYILKRKGKGTRPASTAAQHSGYYEQPKEGHYEVSATPAPAAAQVAAYYQQPKEGYHEVSANPVPIATSEIPELAGSHPTTYNYNYGFAGQQYHSVPQTAPAEMDATRWQGS